MICDRQTDRQTDAREKKICLPTLKGGDIILLYALLSPVADKTWCLDIKSLLHQVNMQQIF